MLAWNQLFQRKLLELDFIFEAADDFCIFEELAVVVFDHSVYLFFFGCQLLLIGKGMKRRDDVFYLCVPDLLPVLFCCFYFFLFHSSCALLNGDEFIIIKLHALLRWFDFDPFV